MKFPEIRDIRVDFTIPASEAALISQQPWSLPQDHETFLTVDDCGYDRIDNEEYTYIYRYESKTGGWVYIHVNTYDDELGLIEDIYLADKSFSWSKFVTLCLNSDYGCTSDAELCLYFDISAEETLNIADEDYSGRCYVWLDDSGHRSGADVGNNSGWLLKPETAGDPMIFDTYKSAFNFINSMYQAHYHSYYICKADD